MEGSSNICRSYMEKLVEEGGFLLPKSWIGLNELEWKNFFVDFIKGSLLQLTAEDCTI